MKSSLRLCFLSLSVFCLLMGLGTNRTYAQNATSPLTAAQGHEEAIKVPAGRFVQDLGDKAISLMADKSLATEQRSNEFRKILRESFDLMTIGRFVIGRSWNAATPDQQNEYIKLFEELIVRTYGDRMSLYTGEGFEVVSVRTESERDSIVISHITHPDGSEPTEIDWRIRQRNGKIGIIDVVVEGVSLSVTQRQEYAAVIQRSGGKIDGLLDLMRQQIQDIKTASSHQE